MTDWPKYKSLPASVKPPLWHIYELSSFDEKYGSATYKRLDRLPDSPPNTELIWFTSKQAAEDWIAQHYD